MKSAVIVTVIVFLFSVAVYAQDDFADPVSRSEVVGADLPGQAFLVRWKNVPAQYVQLMNRYVGERLQQGKWELLVVTGGNSGKTDAAQLRKQFESSAKSAGWNYETHGTENDVTFFTLAKSAPVKQGVFGYWLVVDGRLMIAVTEVFKNDSAQSDSVSNVSSRDSADSMTNATRNTNVSSNQPPQVSNNASAGGQTFELSADDTYVNVMGNAVQPNPSFPALPVKPGKARGYVKDLKGNPIEGALIGVRSTAFGGAYTTASAETDAKGFYEMQIPTGAAFFYTAGYTIDYGEGRVALSLRPADGKVSGFSSEIGVVKNFTLPSYGIANRNKAATAPQDNRNYYGGTLRISFGVNTLEREAGNLVVGETIEITLTPDGEMLDGTAGKTFVIRRQTSERLMNYFFINNIPVGRYKIGARLTNGKPLQLKQVGAVIIPALGLKPKTALGSASLLLSGEADNILVDPSQGNLDEVNIQLSLP